MPKKFELHFLPIAEEDIVEIIDFIAEDKPSAAVNFYNGLEDRFKQLREHPHLGTRRKEPELRRAGFYSLVHGNYITFYTIESNAIVIQRVLSGYRDYLRLI